MTKTFTDKNLDRSYRPFLQANRRIRAITGRLTAARLYYQFPAMAALPAQRDLPFDSASERCEDAIRLLSTGKGNIIRRIEAFRKLGVVPKKELAARMIEASDLDETKEIKVDAGAAA